MSLENRKKFYLRLLNAPDEGGSLVLVIGAWGQKLGIMGQPAENDVLRYLQSPGYSKVRLADGHC